MAGEGPLRGQLEREAAALGIAARVKFLGFVNQSGLPSLYGCADLFVLPSEYDPCPAVVCESMLCGCPVVLSDTIRGRFDLVRHGQTGFIYPCGNLDSLARVLDEVLPDQDRLRRMGRAARQLMETWSPRECVEALVT
jgi:glycosyltransferase involved in cell wall biosynthesis